ncbi:hypothetical protein GQ600_27003 [Phytophthora cactorum]|nr:hypothetical protein GQ600_27003 [Phytophthora cactorum]
MATYRNTATDFHVNSTNDFRVNSTADIHGTPTADFHVSSTTAFHGNPTKRNETTFGRKPTGLSNLHTYLKPGKKKKKDGVPGRDFFVGEEELIKYLDRVDQGTFESYSSASMSSDVAYRYLAQRCYTEAIRKQPS